MSEVEHYVTAMTTNSTTGWLTIACRCGALAQGFPDRVVERWAEHLNRHGVVL